MQLHSTTNGSLAGLSGFLGELVARNLAGVLADSQVESAPEPVKLAGSPVEGLILAASEKVKAMAWKFVRNDQRLDFDDMYQAGMLAVCEAAPNLKAGLNPFPYLIRSAHNAMIDEYRRGRGLAPLSLDAPLADDSSLCLADMLPAPAPSSSPDRSKRSRALDHAMRRL